MGTILKEMTAVV